MPDDPDVYLFQYIQKLIVLSPDLTRVLLAKRKGEVDYNGTFTFIGGKMETTDQTLVDGMKREKDEEIGADNVVRVLPGQSCNILFRKKDGNTTICPHLAAVFKSGHIKLSDEYSEYRWVKLEELAEFGPKIDNITWLAPWAVKQVTSADPTEFTEI